MHIAFLEDHPRGTPTWRQTLVAPFSHFMIQTSIFPPVWDGLFLLNVALAELRSRQLTRSDGNRPATPTRVKVAQILAFSSANAQSTSPNNNCIFQARGKKYFCSKPCLAKKVTQKSTACGKQCFLHYQAAWMPRTSCPDRNNTIGLLKLTLFCGFLEKFP